MTAGHSLGGALSPTLALEMVDRQSEWDPQGLVTVSTSPSAGPTAGNSDFATYFDSRLGSRTNRIWNQVDIVPHAWEVDMLRAIPSIYVPNIPDLRIFDVIVELIILRTRNGSYTQPVGDGNRLPGQYDPAGDDPGLADALRFAQQAGFQHTTGYHQLLGVVELLDLSYQIIGKNAEETAGYASEVKYFQDVYESLKKLAATVDND